MVSSLIKSCGFISGVKSIIYAFLFFNQSAIGKILKKISEKINSNEFSKNFQSNAHFYLFLIMSFPVNAKYRVCVNTTKSWNGR